MTLWRSHQLLRVPLSARRARWFWRARSIMDMAEGGFISERHMECLLHDLGACP